VTPLPCCTSLYLLTHFLSSLHEYFKYVKTANVQCDNAKPISSGGLTLPTLHLAFINHITALRIMQYTAMRIFRILNLYSEQIFLLTVIHCSLFIISMARETDSKSLIYIFVHTRTQNGVSVRIFWFLNVISCLLSLFSSKNTNGIFMHCCDSNQGKTQRQQQENEKHQKAQINWLLMRISEHKNFRSWIFMCRMCCNIFESERVGERPYGSASSFATTNLFQMIEDISHVIKKVAKCIESKSD